MGAAATTAKQPLAEVAIKNEIGAYAEAHGLLDPKAVLFKNLRQFKIAREQIEAIYDEHFSGAVREIRWRSADLGDDWRQRGLNGAPAETLDELYEVGNKALLMYAEVMTAACPSDAVLRSRKPRTGALPLAVTMLWATCPERPPADDDDELAKYKVSDPAHSAKQQSTVADDAAQGMAHGRRARGKAYREGLVELVTFVVAFGCAILLVLYCYRAALCFGARCGWRWRRSSSTAPLSAGAYRLLLAFTVVGVVAASLAGSFGEAELLRA
ncbi:hypothetical protein JL720_12134 [Aureococcus anophagefferens]|nr:hypothetical protein JL720_12134 [Aureococcus anophagefferens]